VTSRKANLFLGLFCNLPSHFQPLKEAENGMAPLQPVRKSEFGACSLQRVLLLQVYICHDCSSVRETSD
jgi:hypothetical protein